MYTRTDDTMITSIREKNNLTHVRSFYFLENYDEKKGIELLAVRNHQVQQENIFEKHSTFTKSFDTLKTAALLKISDTSFLSSCIPVITLMPLH